MARVNRDEYVMHKCKGMKDTYTVSHRKPATKGDVSFMGKLVGKLWLGLLFVLAVIWGCSN